MRIDQLQELAKILERMDTGKIDAPRVPGDIGMFLRAYVEAATRSADLLGVGIRSRRWVSGDEVGPITLTPLTPMEISTSTEPISPVSSVVAASESMGMPFRVTLWTDARSANRANRVWVRDPAATLELRGSYRWFPPARLTPGDADVEVVEKSTPWDRLRCLKYTADDLLRPPDATECHLDWSPPHPGIKAFRVIAIRRGDASSPWSVVPGSETGTSGAPIRVAGGAAAPGGQCLALVYSEPWAPEVWKVIAARPASDLQVLAHNFAWMDYLNELRDEPPISGAQLRGLERVLRQTGLRTADLVEPAAAEAALGRHLLERARPLAAWLRGVS